MSFRALNGKSLCASVALAAAIMVARPSFATVVVTDGFGDGDRDNNGTTEVAPTDVTDVGVPWYYAGSGTSNSILQSVDDSAGIGTGNALQLSNSTGQNNRPIAAHTSTVSLNDGDSLVLRFDMRLVNSVTSDRLLRFGIYNDTANDYIAGDRGSTDTTYNNDVGYMARVDLGADVSNSTTMDIVRDDTNSATILGGTSTTLSPAVQSTDVANKITDANKHHFELTLKRSGADLSLSLQEDSNTILTGTDTGAPLGFNFNEIMFSTRSTALTDYRFDNIQLEQIASVAQGPEPASFGLFAITGAVATLRRRRRR